MQKILVVEDDIFLQNAYRVKLTKSGYEIKVAGNGEEGINTLKDFTPDIILLDLVMPVKDGFTVLEELKNNPQWKNIPVIIASNLGQKEDLEKGMKLGAADYIIKSNISIADILLKVQNVLNQSQNQNTNV